jgi:hypothetical protein
MNIYLDIDGVLLINDSNAAPFADDFLQTVIAKYPDSTFWLTTHCWKGINRTSKLLTPVLKPETVDLLSKIKPTEWGEMKTDAIDFTQPFMWFDDDLWPEEQEALEKHNAVGSFTMIDLNKNPEQLKEIIKHF